jgi:hypothetical protein
MDRKLRLFACACCRHFWEKLDKASRRAVEAAERFADGKITRKALNAARRKVPTEYAGLDEEIAPTAASYTVFPTGEAAAHGAAEATFLLGAEAGRSWQEALRRDIFPPKGVAVKAEWLAANDGAVAKLAAAIYEERDFERLPILADALEEAGCANRKVLAHLRGPGPHVRGCWPVDLCLGLA